MKADPDKDKESLVRLVNPAVKLFDQMESTLKEQLRQNCFDQRGARLHGTRGASTVRNCALQSKKKNNSRHLVDRQRGEEERLTKQTEAKQRRLGNQVCISGPKTTKQKTGSARKLSRRARKSKTN